MNIGVRRLWLTDEWTIGNLTIDGRSCGVTLEDVVRPYGAPKVPGKTAIPAGRYKLELRRSPSWKRTMPYLTHVPGFVGVMFHPGNTPNDSRGCILVGSQADLETGKLIESRAAFDELFEAIRAGAKRDRDGVWIEIEDAPLDDKRTIRRLH